MHEYFLFPWLAQLRGAIIHKQASRDKIWRVITIIKIVMHISVINAELINVASNIEIIIDYKFTLTFNICIFQN